MNDKVQFLNTSDEKLDGAVGTVVGFVDSYKEFPIVLFDSAPEGYNPAIMIAEACLKHSL